MTERKVVELYECTSCGFMYQTRVTRCDCMPDVQEFNDWVARPRPPSNSVLRQRALELFKPPFRFDVLGGYVWDAESNMVADNHYMPDDATLRIRGWGRLSYMESPEALQDTVGELLAEALTAFWEMNHDS